MQASCWVMGEVWEDSWGERGTPWAIHRYHIRDETAQWVQCNNNNNNNNKVMLSNNDNNNNRQDETATILLSNKRAGMRVLLLL